jgi:hypothetical protein
VEAEQKTEACLISLEMDQGEFAGWKPTLEKRLDNLALEVQRANKFMEREAFDHDFTHPGLLHHNESATRRTSAGVQFADGPDGHRDDNNQRVHEWGINFPHTRVLVNGNFHNPIPGCVNDTFISRHDRESHGSLPRINFPHFDGNKPQLWKT